MSTATSNDIALYHGLLERVEQDGESRLVACACRPASIPCPRTGRSLRIATIDAEAQAMCPDCLVIGRGAFVTFVSDLRMAYACPDCRQFVWLASA